MIPIRKDTIFHQFKTARSWALNHLEKLEEKDEKFLHTIPEGFPNSLHWQFGHIAAMSEFASVKFFDHENEVAERFLKYFDYGTKTQDFDENTPTIADIKQLLETQVDSFNEDITDDLLETPLENDSFGAKDFGEYWGFFIIHEALHIGKIEEMKRVLENQGL